MQMSCTLHYEPPLLPAKENWKLYGEHVERPSYKAQETGTSVTRNGRPVGLTPPLHAVELLTCLDAGQRIQRPRHLLCILALAMNVSSRHTSQEGS